MTDKNAEVIQVTRILLGAIKEEMEMTDLELARYIQTGSNGAKLRQTAEMMLQEVR